MPQTTRKRPEGETMSKTKPEEFPLTPREEKILFNTGRRVFATAFPNPERKGCPGSQVLKNLVFRVGTLSITERQQWFDHSAHCSPCFNEIAAFRKQYLNQRKIRRSVLVLVIVGFLSWIAFRLGFQEGSKQPDIVQPVVTPPSAPEPAPIPPSVHEQQPAEVQVVVLDLRKRGVARGESNTQDGDLNLPRGRLKLSIYLPIGSEEGNYEVRISGLQNQVLRAKGKAGMQGHLNVVAVEVDTSAFEVGSYTLAIRQTGWGWNRYALKVK